MQYQSFRFRFKDLLVCAIVHIFLITIFTGCATNKPYELNLMPAPGVFDNDVWQPFSDTSQIKNDGTIEILYATDREPANEQSKEKFYQNKRGYLLRLGKGEVKVGKGDYTWEELKQISLLKNRTENLPLQVTGVKEYGILNTTISELDSPKLKVQKSTEPAEYYASVINTKLANSKNKDIYVYLHGYKVNFENPLLVTSELWHYLGYEGVFIAFAWPSTPSLWAYASDAETAAVSARNLRLFLQFLSEKTAAREIHIVGYSMGTRLVTKALHSLALIHNGQDKQTIHKQLRIGHVILVGSDAEGAMTGNGHAYFRKSPWASSDILVTLAYDFKPAERGLTRTQEKPIWVFPSDYIERLKSILADSNPVLSPLKK